VAVMHTVSSKVQPHSDRVFVQSLILALAAPPGSEKLSLQSIQDSFQTELEGIVGATTRPFALVDQSTEIGIFLCYFRELR
jgi:hypothetical protein